MHFLDFLVQHTSKMTLSRKQCSPISHSCDAFGRVAWTDVFKLDFSEKRAEFGALLSRSFSGYSTASSISVIRTHHRAKQNRRTSGGTAAFCFVASPEWRNGRRGGLKNRYLHIYLADS